MALAFERRQCSHSGRSRVVSWGSDNDPKQTFVILTEKVMSRVFLGIVLATSILCGPASAQPSLTIIALDFVRTDRVSSETRHDILPLALFDGTQIKRLSRPFVVPGTLPGPDLVQRNRIIAAERNSRREDVLALNPSFYVLYRGRSIGSVKVSEVDVQAFHCTGNVVGTGNFEARASLPQSDMKDSVWAWQAGETTEYETEAFIAISGTASATPFDDDAIVTLIEDRVELQHYADDVLTLKPRADLLPLGEDETRAYRLDPVDAVVVVRKRRSAEILPGPAGSELPSPLLTDIVVISESAGERVVRPLYSSQQDAWGRGFRDFFMDAFALGDGNVYFAFERRGNESTALRLFRIGLNGGATEVFSDELHGC